MTAIVDYRAGNLTSVRYAFAALGAEAAVTRDPAAVRAADRVVFPGVGAARRAMESLRALGLEAAVREAAATKPFLGVCLGMQILFDRSEEDGGVDTLGVLPGQVRRFPDVAGFKVPEIGWNQVEMGEMGSGKWEVRGEAACRPQVSRDPQVPQVQNPQVPQVQDVSAAPREYYFVHSYYADLCPYTVGTAEYAGVTFTAMVKKGRLWACQFHPEKSGRVGLDLIREWLSC